MTKRMSTLVASLLLAGSFGTAYAEVGNLHVATFEDGKTYFLTTTDASATASALMVEGEDLVMRAWAANAGTEEKEIAEMSKLERRYAQWEVKITTTVAGGKTYSFTNVATGKTLSVSGAAVQLGKSYVKDGVSEFEFELANGGASSWTAAELSNKASGSTLTLMNVQTLSENAKTGGTANLSDFDGKGSKKIELIEVSSKNARMVEYFGVENPSISLSGTNGNEATVEEMGNVRNIAIQGNKLMKDLGVTPQKGGDWDNWQKAVLDVIVPEAGVVDASGTIYNLWYNAWKMLTDSIKANAYGWTIDIGKENGGVPVRGVVDGKTPTLINDRTYEKGTRIVSELRLMPSIVPVDSWGSTQNSSALAVADDADGAYKIGSSFGVAEFANKFRRGSEADSAVYAALKFEGPAASEGKNILADQEIRLVQRNLPEVSGSTGKSVAFSSPEAPDGSKFKSTTLVQNKDGKYLVLEPATWDENGSYYKLGWAGLKNLTACVSNKVAGVSYYNGDGFLAAAYLFDVIYDESNDSLTIAPHFLISKTASYDKRDTIGTTYKIDKNDDSGNNVISSSSKTSEIYRASLKKFDETVVMTVVKPETDKAYRIYTGEAASTDKTWTLADAIKDVKYIQFLSGKESEKSNTGKYLTAGGKLVEASTADLAAIPENQWNVVTAASGVTNIVNRATGKTLELNGKTYEDVTLYRASALKADGAVYVSTYLGDTLKLTSVPAAVKGDSTVGYFAYDKDQNNVLKYKLTYFNELDASKMLNVSKDSVLYVDKKGASVWFQLIPGEPTNYGAAAISGVSKRLKKATYTLTAIVNGKKYNVVELESGKYGISAIKAGKGFDLKVATVKDSTSWYVLKTTDGEYKASVSDNTLELFKEATTEVRTSMFALTDGDAPIYRRLGATVEDGIAKNDTAYVEFFKANEPSRFLYENSQNIVAENGTKVASDSLNFLGMYNVNDLKKNASIFVDTAYVRDNTVMPMYMLASAAEYHAAKAEDTCAIHGKDCEHYKAGIKANIAGRYLVALTDSSDNKSAYYQGAPRLAFVPATHVQDTLVIANSEFTGTKDAGNDSIVVKKLTLNKATFAFELVENNTDADFYIKNSEGYVRIHNGVPVLVSEKEDAAVFNVQKSNVKPTANGKITAEGVKVIAGEGFVTVKGAAGKKVVVANILGQTVANTVVSSDEAQIAAPAGVVVVAVEGEAAQKAIVK